jgi:hypothetical protein
MKKELLVHYGTFAVLFFVITLLRRWFDIPYALFWFGGIVGTALPDIDHLIYVYYLRPHELTSQRVQYMAQKADIKRTLELLATTRSERKNLIFHTAWFQIFFLVLMVWIMTSSSNLFGRGLVLAFSLHLVVDQLVDLMHLGNLDTWFRQLPIKWDKEKLTLYVVALLLVISIFAILL